MYFKSLGQSELQSLLGSWKGRILVGQCLVRWGQGMRSEMRSGQGSWKVHEVVWQLLYWPSHPSDVLTGTASALDKHVSPAERLRWGSGLAPPLQEKGWHQDQGLCQHCAAKGQNKGIPKDVQTENTAEVTGKDRFSILLHFRLTHRTESLLCNN